MQGPCRLSDSTCWLSEGAPLKTLLLMLPPNVMLRLVRSHHLERSHQPVKLHSFRCEIAWRSATVSSALKSTLKRVEGRGGEGDDAGDGGEAKAV